MSNPDDDFFPVKKGSCAFAFQKSKPDEHFLSDEQGSCAQIFEQVKQIILLKLHELNGDRCSKLSTVEQGG